jgi:hypothetical protein
LYKLEEITPNDIRGLIKGMEYSLGRRKLEIIPAWLITPIFDQDVKKSKRRSHDRRL